MPLLSTRGANAAKGFGLTGGAGRRPYNVNYLVIAGGGGGGGGGQFTDSGAGGAGGYRTSYGPSGGGASAESEKTLSPKTVYAP